MKNIIIFGGGISGLTSAHELIELNYDVTIIERNDIVGGLARTYGDEKKKYVHMNIVGERMVDGIKMFMI